MKTKHIPLLFLAALFTISSLNAQQLSLKTVQAVIKGTSSLHDWESAINKIEFKGNVMADNGTPKAVKDVLVNIPVKSIKSSEGKIMDNKTYDAFKADTYPSISFTVQEATIVVDAAKNITITAPGKLSMAGATQPTTVIGTGKILPNGDWQITVVKKIVMTQYAMKPPTAMMGTIKVGDEVTVQVNLTLTHTSIASK